MSFIYPAPVVTTRRNSDYTGSILTVQDILASNLLKIPHYQRSYKWDKSRIHDLLDDIFMVMRMDNAAGQTAGKTHMMTNMILHDEITDDGTVVCNIVDGQQRITTLFIILTVMMRELRLLQEKSDNPDATRLMIQMEELVYQDPTGPGYTPRMAHAHPSEGVVFREVTNLNATAQTLSKASAMAKAPSIVSQYVREYFGSLYNAKIGAKTPLPFNFIKHVFSVATRGLEFYVLRTQNGVAAQRTYADLNSKGKELDGFETIKNVLSQNMSTDAFIHGWDALEKGLAGSDAEQDQDRFFRTWIHGKDPYVGSAAKKIDRQFFHLLSTQTVNADEATLLEMAADAQRYTQHTLGKSQQKDVDGLFWLNQLGTQHRPLMMAAKPLEMNDPKAFATFCEELSRTIIVMQTAGVRANTMSIMWKKWTKAIANVQTREDLDSFLENFIYAERAAFEDGLEENIFHLGTKTKWNTAGRPKNKLLSTVVSHFAYHLQKMSGHSKSACAFMETATLEHIVPVRSGHSVSSPISTSAFQHKVSHLGNLTVMNGAENASASNRPVAEKMDLYEGCPIILTQAGVRELPCENSKGKAAKILRKIPKISGDFNLEHIETRGRSLSLLVTESLLG